MGETQSATFEVTRRGDGNGRLRRMTITCDGTVRLTLRTTDVESFDVEPGVHVLRASMDWVASELVSIRVEGGQTLRLRTALHWNPFRSFWKPQSSVVLRVLIE